MNASDAEANLRHAINSANRFRIPPDEDEIQSDPLPLKRECVNCSSFRKTTTSEGQCRGERPIVLSIYDGNHNVCFPETHWPTVQNDDWCGKFFEC